MASEALHTLYRPQDWSEIIGQDVVVNSLSLLIERRETHCVILGGPSGVGKTTIARIAAMHLGCERSDIREANAGKDTGVEDMRNLIETIRLMPLGGRPVVYIIDEAHMLSRNSWNALLKDTEEPPPWAFFFFCTTEPGKIPAAMITRSHQYLLRPVPWEDLLELIIKPVAELEVIGCGDDIMGMIARAAEGSPRQALVYLAECRNTTDPAEARMLLQQAAESEKEGAFRLAKQLMAGGTWEVFKPLLVELKEENPEGVRRVIVKYATTSLLNANSDKHAQKSAAILDMFGVPYNTSEGFTPLVTAVARLVLLS